MTRATTAVVILNYNGRHFLEKFLPKVVAHSVGADVVVADNASTDGSVEYLQINFPQVQLIEFDRNHGFAEGYNLALANLKHKYFVLLNSDVEVTPNWLSTLENYLDENNDVVVVQPKILSYHQPDTFEYAGACGGFIDRYGYPFCRGRVFDTVEKDNGQYTDNIDIMWASGACLMIRANNFFQIGGLDSRFFAYQEEIDLCWRLNAIGKRIVCVPQSVVYHVGSGVLGSDSPRKTYLNFRNNLILLYKNLHGNRLFKVMFVRWWLDYLAAFQLLISGKYGNAKSVLKARKDFARTKRQFRDNRTENLAATVVPYPKGIAPISLLWCYYVQKKRTFDKLGITT